MIQPVTTPRLHQPGPVLHPRLPSLPARTWSQDFVLEPGLSLLHTVQTLLQQIGVSSAVLELRGGSFGPFAYVLPAHAPDSTHVAWYSAPYTPEGGADLERANVTFGEREGNPWLHCHAVWREQGNRRGGHVLPEETIIAAPIAVRAWCLADAGFSVAADAETNFALFNPKPLARPRLPHGTHSAAVLRIRPNEDLVAAIETTCRRYGFRCAEVRGGVGSLVAPRFVEGHAVSDIATEFLVTNACISPEAGVMIHAMLAGMDGQVHEGLLMRGANNVCITCELVLQEMPSAGDAQQR